ncbi:MAG TPA: FAD-dependent oxidoreductase, partial [Thermoleophilia bacterium]
MKGFEFVNAPTLEAAAELLEARGKAAKAVAGGTDALGTLKDHVHPGYPEVLVNLKTIKGLDYIRSDGDEVAIGSLTRLHALETDPLIRERYPMLAEAARAVASPQLRNMGTVGGNICQEPRCWYYRYPDNYFDCMRKGGTNCNALTGENRFHSLFGSAPVVTRPCSANCPGSIDIPSYMAELRSGNVDAAARILLEQNPLPAITGRVCPHYCEQNCNRGLWDEAVSVRSAERYLGDYVLDHPAEILTAPAAAGAPVAVVGAGPAGLACAFYLRRAGHPVTVLEKMPEAGGMLRYGIPPYRLSAGTIRSQVAALEQMGIEFRYGVEVGRDIQLSELRTDYAAVFVAPGAWGQAKLGLEHEDLLAPGLPFLRDVKEGLREKPGDKVVVIGGGNVAVDVALSAKRLGATEVTMVCLECEDEMPALSWEVEQARAGGVTVYPSWGPAHILTSGGRLTGLELVHCSCVFDAQGSFNPTFDQGTRNTIAADKVFLAIGQRADLGAIDADGQLRAGRPWIKADENTQATELAGVFAGGDVVSGPSTVIASIGAGRRGAFAILDYLGDQPVASSPRDEDPGLGRFNSSFLQKVPRVAATESLEAVGGLDVEESTTLDGDAVEYEANRCFNCGCVAVSPSDLAPALLALGARIKTT